MSGRRVIMIELVIDGNIVTKNKDGDGEYIEIDYSNLMPDTNYVVNYDNQLYGVKRITDGKFEFFEVMYNG